MALFTAIFEYKGGNYTSQIRARSVSTAFRVWIETVDQRGIPGIGPSKRDRAVRDLIEDRERGYRVLIPALLDGLQGVWFCGVPDSIQARGACLNIVQTVTVSSAPPNKSFKRTRQKRRAA